MWNKLRFSITYDVPLRHSVEHTICLHHSVELVSSPRQIHTACTDPFAEYWSDFSMVAGLLASRTRLVPSSVQSYDQQLAADLWNLSADIAKVPR